jgi:galactonate dehydratase
MAQAALSPPPSSSLAITGIEAWNIRQPVGGRTWGLVRLSTSEGLEGWGESKPLSRETAATLRTALKGANAHSYEALRVKLKGHPACAGVNAAALDILGKAAKVPVYQLLGGPTRNRVRAYTSLHGANDEAILENLREAKAAGHRTFAVPVPTPPFRNSGKALVLATQKRMDRMRQAAGDGADLILNGSGHLTPGDAAILADAFERYHVLFFDEPCSNASLGALRKISAENVTPLAFGAGATEASHFQDLLREDAVDLCRPELAIHGISGVRKIAVIAEVNYVAVAPRNNEGPLGTAACFHLAASLPNFFIQHIPFPNAKEDREMRTAITGGNVEAVQNGYAALNTQPGLGIRVNRDALQKYGEALA